MKLLTRQFGITEDIKCAKIGTGKIGCFKTDIGRSYDLDSIEEACKRASTDLPAGLKLKSTARRARRS